MAETLALETIAKLSTPKANFAKLRALEPLEMNTRGLTCNN